jgi:hypothetical protein
MEKQFTPEEIKKLREKATVKENSTKLVTK